MVWESIPSSRVQEAQGLGLTPSERPCPFSKHGSSPRGMVKGIQGLHAQGLACWDTLRAVSGQSPTLAWDPGNLPGLAPYPLWPPLPVPGLGAGTVVGKAVF